MSVSSSPLTKALDHPTRSLTIVFILWKIFLLLVASCSPGPGYDTSTSLAQHTEGERIVRNVLTSSLSHISQKLTRWDAIYFTSIARRGYIYEQEWAFGWGFTHIISFFTVDLKGAAFDYEFLESIVGISIAHVAHGLSVLAIYCLTRAIFPGAQSKKLAFVTACLYILSPAGLFLSAPYGESTYALLSFTGYLLFVRGYGVDGQLTTLHDLSTMVAGMLLAAATTIRSNGILHGIVFLESAFRLAWSLKDGLKWRVVRRLAAVVFGGLCIGMGFVLPQWIAYNEFCTPVLAMENGQPRVWCQRTLPSVYTFVQDYYWKVGFLRYWRSPNIPLFLFAAPMLAIMTVSSLSTIFTKPFLDVSLQPTLAVAGFEGQEFSGVKRTRRLLRTLALPQLLLALLALTSYHVQIITRISSGYPVWYFWLASHIVEANGSLARSHSKDYRRQAESSAAMVRYVIVYAVVQGGLFASFLPPA